MESINHECYVDLEVAEMLKKAGFDWECRKIYYCYREDDDTWELEDNYKIHKHILELDYCLLAPTLDVAQRWLREVKGVYLDIDTHFNSVGVWFSYVINVLDSDAKFGMYSNCLGAGHSFNEHKEALEAGIKKALELILKKGKQ